MTVNELCSRYLSALEKGDLEEIVALYSDEATVKSPISASTPVRTFFTNVFRITSERTAQLHTVLLGVDHPNRAAVHFAYTRAVRERPSATVECVDLFELSDDRQRFIAQQIIYDTGPVRADFDSLS